MSSDNEKPPGLLQSLIALGQEMTCPLKSGKGIDMESPDLLQALTANPAGSLPVPKRPAAFQPLFPERRVVFVVDGTLSRLSVCRQATDIMEGVYGGAKKGVTLKSKLMWSMDGHLHSTGWSDSPGDMGGQTRNAHCWQQRTRFADALTTCLEDVRREGPIDAVIVIGNRCDDDVADLTQRAQKLKETGAKIFSLPLPGTTPKALEGYEAIASKGACLQLTQETSIADVLPSLTDYLFNREDAAHAMLTHSSSDVRRLGTTLLSGTKPK